MPRQLDSTPASLEVLPAIAAAVGDRTQVLMDGGVRSGQDVVKSPRSIGRGSRIEPAGAGAPLSEATAAERARVRALSASERVHLALELGRRSLELHCARTGESAERARREIERPLQARRRASSCLADLLA